MRISRERVTEYFFLFTLFISTGSMEALTARGATSDSSGSPLMKVLWASVYLAVILGMVRRYREILALLGENKAFVAMILLMVLSSQWSINPSATLSKSIPLLLSALVGLDFARRYTTREQVRMIWLVLATVLVLGVIAQVFFPGLVPNGGDDEMAATSWRGIVTTKNTWARLVVLGGVIILSRPRTTRASSYVTTFLMVLIFGILAASKSAGGIVIMVVMTALFPLFKFLRWKRKKVVVLVGLSVPSILAVGAAILIANLTSILTALGKDPTMTGRLPLWHECLHFISKRPLLGYGFAAFWGPDSRPAALISEATNGLQWPHAHDGYIDMLLTGGCLGLALYTISFFVGAIRAARHVRRFKGQDALWPLAFLCVIFLYQIDEAPIVAANQFLWLLFSAVLFSLAIEKDGTEPLLNAVDLEENDYVLVAGE
jgi:O-antigen ligase